VQGSEAEPGFFISPGHLVCVGIQYRLQPVSVGCPDVAVVGPFTGIVQGCVAEIDEDFPVHARILRKIPVDSRNSETCGTVPDYGRGTELHFLSDRRFLSEQFGRSSFGYERHARSAEQGGVPFRKFEWEYFQQTVIAVGELKAYPGLVAPGLPHGCCSPLVVNVRSNCLGLGQDILHHGYHRSGPVHTVGVHVLMCGVFQPVYVLVSRITSVVSPVVHHLHHQYHEHREGEGQSRYIQDGGKESVAVEVYASHGGVLWLW